MQTLSHYASAVRKYVHFRLAPQTDHADDIVQSIFLAACENLDAYRGDSSLRSWLMGIARNKVRDHYRARLREPETLGSLAESTYAKSTPPRLDDFLDKESIRKKIRDVLNTLPEKYRTILLWRYWEDFPVKTIASRIGKTEKATERLLARAREDFRWAWHHQTPPARAPIAVSFPLPGNIAPSPLLSPPFS